MSEEKTAKQSSFSGQQWLVHKFGGTSVASAECYLKVADIVQEQTNPADPSHQNLHIAVVVSAMGGKPKTTDLLLSCVSLAAKRESAEPILQQILDKHTKCLSDLFGAGSPAEQTLTKVIRDDLEGIRDILKTVALMKWEASRISELVSGYGELWSAQILAALLSQRAAQSEEPRHEYVYVDARRFIIVDEDAIQDGAICWDDSLEKLQQVYKGEIAKLPGDVESVHMVITGYVASNTHGVATTLQRDGSDYSASIVGRLLQAKSISIWTDVDGVLSADPRRVPRAHVLEEVSYNEAMELAYFGAKVIHPKTMQPAISSNPQIPIFIRNTFHPAFRGTRIYTSSTTHTDREKCVCGFSSIEDMALVNVEGSGLIGVPGVAKRLFGTLESEGINVVLISQASSEHTITFATAASQAASAKAAIEEEFRRELAQMRISSVDIKSPCSIIAAVGDGMYSMAGVSGRFFAALGDAKINILAISQGSSERNISAVVYTAESTRALRAVHAAFRLSHTTVRVGVVGMNELGDSLLALLESQRVKLRETFDVDLQVCAVIQGSQSDETSVLKNDSDGGSDSITLSAHYGLTGEPVRTAALAEIDGSDDCAKLVQSRITSFLGRVFRDECAHHVIFDCTNDCEVGKLHSEWLRAGVHVVTANNTGLSGTKEQRDEIYAAERLNGKLSAKYLREVTVGGGLPILNTLRDLLNTGDYVRRVDGIFSVSWSHIMYRISPPPNSASCNEYDFTSSSGAFRRDESLSPNASSGEASCSFSDAVKEAVGLGLMEVDPTHDLDNEYTSRVLMVLAKELGLDRGMETSDIQKASEKLVDVEEIGDDFRSISSDIDQKVKERVDAAARRGCVLRHISSVDVKSGLIGIKIEEVPNSHVFATNPPSCECARFFTQRHRSFPLVIQGPSAGADSTASALLAEVLNLMRNKVGPRYGALSRTASSAFLS